MQTNKQASIHAVMCNRALDKNRCICYLASRVELLIQFSITMFNKDSYVKKPKVLCTRSLLDLIISEKRKK
jgi:hypothetical protein